MSIDPGARHDRGFFGTPAGPGGPEDDDGYAPDEGLCDWVGHEWEDMGGGMEICSACLTEREAPRE